MNAGAIDEAVWEGEGASLRPSLTIEIGGNAVAIRSRDGAFLELLEERYLGFITPGTSASASFEVEIIESASVPTEECDDELKVSFRGGAWDFRRGDFRATWQPSTRAGHIVQTCNPYAIDSVLRILHSILLVPQRGLLMHAASAIRGDRAFVFAGVSGAGKTTICRLAPPDAILLSDEVSYLRPDHGEYRAWGTPFSGELAKSGENISAPVSALYLLEQGTENRIDPVAKIDAIRSLLRHVLFFAYDARLVESIFDAVRTWVDQVPVCRLTFKPEAGVWNIIGSV